MSESAEWVVSGLRELREIAEDAHSDSGLIAGEMTKSLECELVLKIVCTCMI